jgi:hypothetical protein
MMDSVEEKMHNEDDRYFDDDEYCKLIVEAKTNDLDIRLVTAQAASIRLQNNKLSIDEIISCLKAS